jgi:hypothetical protein
MRCAVCAATVVDDAALPHCDGCRKCVCATCKPNMEPDLSRFRCDYCVELPGTGDPMHATTSIRQLGKLCMGKRVEFALEDAAGAVAWARGTLVVSRGQCHATCLPIACATTRHAMRVLPSMPDPCITPRALHIACPFILHTQTTVSTLLRVRPCRPSCSCV